MFPFKLCASTFGKSMNLSTLSPNYKFITENTGFLEVIPQAVQVKENCQFKPAVIRKKNELLL